MELLLDNPETEISVSLILQLYRILMQNIRDDASGRFRTNKEWVRVGIISVRIRNSSTVLCRI